MYLMDSTITQPLEQTQWTIKDVNKTPILVSTSLYKKTKIVFKRK